MTELATRTPRTRSMPALTDHARRLHYTWARHLPRLCDVATRPPIPVRYIELDIFDPREQASP